jgi:hypothetical protein
MEALKELVMAPALVHEVEGLPLHPLQHCTLPVRAVEFRLGVAELFLIDSGMSAKTRLQSKAAAEAGEMENAAEEKRRMERNIWLAVGRGGQLRLYRAII